MFSSETRDYCLHESFNATCRPGFVILMTSANYGRMKLGRCINGDFNIGCSKDVIRYFDSQCSAKETCDVSVRNLVDVHPCQRDFMSYLETSYRCIEGRCMVDKRGTGGILTRCPVVWQGPGKGKEKYSSKVRCKYKILCQKVKTVLKR